MKWTVLFTTVWLLVGCQSLFDTKHAQAHAKIPEVREFVIKDLEIKDPQAISFINSTEPEFKTVHGITYYYWKDKQGKSLYTAEANSESLDLLNAVKGY